MDPALLVGVVDVHVLGADGAAIGGARDVEDLAQGGLGRTDQRPGVEGRIEVLVREPVEGRVELRHFRALVLAQGVEVGLPMATKAVGVDELEHGDLLLKAVVQPRIGGT